MFRSVRFNLMDSLNPVENEKFIIVLNGLLNSGYISFNDESQDFLLLGQKGYDLIYDDDKISHYLSMPWVIPGIQGANWEKSYNILWRAIGIKDECPAYITGPKFYSIASKIDDTIPPSYSQFYEKRKEEGKSLSRVDFFKGILDGMPDEKRYLMYAELQSYIDETQEEKIDKSKSLFDDLALIDNPNEKSAPVPVTNKATAKETPMVYVSYSWSQSEEMDEICAALENNAVTYKRDKKDCGYRQNIKRFEEEIGKGNIVIAVISDKYLKSLHCMHELSSLIENGYIEDRLFPIVYIDGHDASSMKEYMNYWTEQYNNRVEIVSSLPAGCARVAIDELYCCDVIISNLSRFWSYITQFNTSTPEDIKAEEYHTLIQSIKDKLQG